MVRYWIVLRSKYHHDDWQEADDVIKHHYSLSVGKRRVMLYIRNEGEYLKFNRNWDFQFNFNFIVSSSMETTFFCFTWLVKHFGSISSFFFSSEDSANFLRRKTMMEFLTKLTHIWCELIEVQSSWHYIDRQHFNELNAWVAICHLFLFELLLTMKINIFIHPKIFVGLYQLVGLPFNSKAFTFTFDAFYLHIANFLPDSINDSEEELKWFYLIRIVSDKEWNWKKISDARRISYVHELKRFSFGSLRRSFYRAFTNSQH